MEEYFNDVLTVSHHSLTDVGTYNFTSPIKIGPEKTDKTNATRIVFLNPCQDVNDWAGCVETKPYSLTISSIAVRGFNVTY